MTPQEIAADIARELREHPERWTQGEFARDPKGNGVLSTDKSAVCWCIRGHLRRRCGYGENGNTAVGLFEELADNIFLAEWNDERERTVADVIALCDKVAAS